MDPQPSTLNPQLPHDNKFTNPEYAGVLAGCTGWQKDVTLRPANTNRVHGWAEILRRLGDPDAGIKPTLFIHERCKRLLGCLPYLQHDPDHPADVLKTNANEEGLGGDDAADAARYLVVTKRYYSGVRKLRGL